MPCPHFDIAITKRSNGQSAVAGAAYQSGERLHSERDNKIKDYSRKQGIAYTQVMLPANAPPEYADREILWNSVEKIEGQWNSQLARRIVAALPREFPLHQLPDLVREYCRDNFVEKGMCVDFAIHDPDPPGHNPHVHIMLTLRAMDENGKWLPKAHKVYDLDENGERIRLQSGSWKSHKENTVDWNEQYHAEEWRHSWEMYQNRYLEMNDRPERIDMRSFERQGIAIAPAVHLGPAVSAMEQQGIRTDIGNLNRDIRRVNRILLSLVKTISQLLHWIRSISEKRRELSAEIEKPVSADLYEMQMLQFNKRKLERVTWKDVFRRNEADRKDREKLEGMSELLRRYDIHTFDDMAEILEEMQDTVRLFQSETAEAEKRMKQIEANRRNAETYRKLYPIYKEYNSKGWKVTKEHFYQKHKKEIDTFRRVKRNLENSVGDLSGYSSKQESAEYEALQSACEDRKERIAQARADISTMGSIRYYITDLLPQQAGEEQGDAVRQKPMPSIPEQQTARQRKTDQVQSSLEAVKSAREEKTSRRKSVLGRLHDAQGTVAVREAQRKQVQRKPVDKKRTSGMDL